MCAERSDNGSKLWYALHVPDDFASGKDIRICSMAGWFREIVSALNKKDLYWIKETVKHAIWTWLSELFVILIRDGGAYGILISMYLKGKMTIDSFVLYFAAISSFAEWIGGIIKCFNGMRAVTNSISDFRDYVDYPKPQGKVSAFSSKHMSKAPKIVFENVTYRYQGAEEDTIKNINLRVKPGEKLALVGLNGAGKTTLVKLLCGLYDPTEGEILLNGVNIKKYDYDEYMSIFSVVFQDFKLFSFRVGEVVASSRNYDPEWVKDCLIKANFGSRLSGLNISL